MFSQCEEEEHRHMAAGIGGKAHQGTDGSPPDDAGNSPFSSSDHEGKLSILLHLTEQHHYSGFHAATDRWIIIYCKKRGKWILFCPGQDTEYSESDQSLDSVESTQLRQSVILGKWVLNGVHM